MLLKCRFLNSRIYAGVLARSAFSCQYTECREQLKWCNIDECSGRPSFLHSPAFLSLLQNTCRDFNGVITDIKRLIRHHYGVLCQVSGLVGATTKITLKYHESVPFSFKRKTYYPFERKI